MYLPFFWWNDIYVVKHFCQKCYEHNTILERGYLKSENSDSKYTTTCLLKMCCNTWNMFMINCNDMWKGFMKICNEKVF